MREELGGTGVDCSLGAEGSRPFDVRNLALDGLAEARLKDACFPVPDAKAAAAARALDLPASAFASRRRDEAVLSVQSRTSRSVQRISWRLARLISLAGWISPAPSRRKDSVVSS
jgi:hypothetical protein